MNELRSQEAKAHEIPVPPATLAQSLPAMDLDDLSRDWAEIVEEHVSKAVQSVEEVDWTILDVIGAKMEEVTNEFSHFMETTQDLFTALVRLKQVEKDAVQAKKEDVIAILTKLRATLEFLRKV